MAIDLTSVKRLCKMDKPVAAILLFYKHSFRWGEETCLEFLCA